MSEYQVSHDMPPVITIDGPSGSGKGTVSSLLAETLQWSLLDSGALYRVLAYGLEKHKLWDKPLQQWLDLAQRLPVSFPLIDGRPQAHYEQLNVESMIRTETAGAQASRAASVPEVRDALLHRQREFLTMPGLVADGRDMGTVIFPQAPLKVFLTASVEERAHRRYFQLKEKGENVSLAALLEDIQKRDERDTNRTVSPLVPADDALLLDSTSLSIDEVFAIILNEAKLRKITF